MRYAIIDRATNLVINVAVWDGVTDWTPGPGLSVIRSDEAGIGWTYDPETGSFDAPDPDPEPV